MTTETPNAPAPVISAQEAEIAARRKAVTDAEAVMAAATKATEDASNNALAATPASQRNSAFWVALGKLAEPTESAENVLSRAREALRVEETKGYWERTHDMRQPTLTLLRTLLVANPPHAEISAARGVMKFAHVDAVAAVAEIKASDGTVTPASPAVPAHFETTVILRPEIGEIDMSDIEEMVADSANPEAYLAEGIASIDINVLRIGKPDASISLMPTSAVTVAAKVKVGSSMGTRATGRKYLWNGTLYGSRDFLVAIEASGHAIAKERAQSFDTVLRGTGNGLANLAKELAPKVGAVVQDAAQ